MTYTPAEPPKGLSSRVSFAVEKFITTRLVPKKVGPVMRLFFKIPVLFYRLGLGGLVGGSGGKAKILVLVTTGRKSGKKRCTPLEFGRDPGTGAFMVLTGWGGRSDWYRNALKNPAVEVWVGRERLPARAEAMPQAELVAFLREMIRLNPGVVSIFEASSGIRYDGTESCLEQLAAHFPALVLWPE